MLSSPPRPKGMNRTNGRSIKTTLSDSRPAGHLNNSSSFPTTSVVSRRGVPRCFFAIDSADGCIVSRRCKHIRTNEIATGAEMPVRGLISTLPSIRGWQSVVSANLQARRTSRSNSPMSPICLDSQQGNYCSAAPRLGRMLPSCLGLTLPTVTPR